MMSDRPDMLRRMGSVSYGDGIAREYLAAEQKFRFLRRSCRRQATCGRHFVLATRITEELNRGRSTSAGSGLYNLMWTGHSTMSDTPAKIGSQELENMSRIYCILLDMDMQNLIEHFHQLSDNDLPLTKTILEQKIGRDVLEDDLNAAQLEDFYDRFCQTQMEWCPLVFEWRMHAVITDQIIPYYHMERIEPNRGSRSTANDRAKLYEIHVPEELVGPLLREKLKSTRLLQTHQKDNDMVDPDGRPILHECRYYRFALKEFPKHLKDDFDRERHAFDALKDQSGMIQYYGWYEFKGESEHTYNIVLEYADFDLHTAFKKESPPVSQNEIRGFWEQMMGLSTTLHNIHRLDVDGHEYDFWHGDIKPENILRVENQFKLADPGDGRIRLASKGNDQPRARVYGGTWTYSSPEKAQYFHGKTTDAASILKNSDVWSLACVFSMAATYVVLGTQGVVIYDRVRRNAHKNSGCEFVSDDFHDGENVLAVIKEWHNYLRHSTRLTDAHTWQILNMIDEHLLIMPPEKRWDADKVSEELRNIIEHSQFNALEVPDSIVEVLQQIDLEAEIAVESSVNVNRVNSDMVKRHIQEQRQLGQAVDENTESKSRAELFINTQILPTAQRSEHREKLLDELLQRYGGATTDLPRLVSLPSFESNISGRLSLLSITPSGEIITEDASTPMLETEDPTQPLPEHPMTMWEMEDELESKAMKTRLRAIRSERRNKPVAAKGRFTNDPLENKYTQRDIVYLVDNGSSMARHWRNAIHLLRILTWRSLGYDDDGMELYFTDPNTKISVPQSQQQAVGDFVDAMKQARPKSNVKDEKRSKTDISQQLNRIIMNYVDERRRSGKERKKTIIILTDGVWEGMAGEYELDDCIKFLFRQVANQHKGDRTSKLPEDGLPKEETDQQILERIRPVTIQFVAFGQDKPGLERMKRLDDHIGDGWPDLIDMEPANGCVYKMFLGSLIPDWDYKVNRVNSMVPNTPIRPGLEIPFRSASGSGSRSRASSATGHLASPSDVVPTTPAKKHPPLSRAQHSGRVNWGSMSPSVNGHNRHDSAELGPMEQDWSRQPESTPPI